MLKLFRSKHVTKIVLWGLLILILPAFVLWGTGNTGRSTKGGPKYVGIIENRKVSFENFADSLYSIRCQVVLNYYGRPETLDAILGNKEFLGKLAWDRLIMLQKARAARIKVSDKEVVGFITSHPLFLRNGKFDDHIYQYFLKNSLGIYPRSFEELVRENLMIQKLTDIITKDVKIADEEIAADYGRDNSRFAISYITIPLKDFTGKITVTDGEIVALHKKHEKDFMFQAKDATGKKGVKRQATLEEARETIRTLLVEDKARPLAEEKANAVCEEINGLISGKKLSFEDAASKLGFKAQASGLFGRTDSVEDIGEMAPIIPVATALKKDEISKPVGVKKGFLVFTVSQTQAFDPEKFKKEKDDYSRIALAVKKNAYMEDWLREREKGAKLNIDLRDYEKYYK
ncbi:MAG: SurA N-terminal domain-containing protein [Candidatus Omnitrophica bacterium]|nr:SurA N-terminal domain-containing protein [Candidatus Omnitrophota bacterium]